MSRRRSLLSPLAERGARGVTMIELTIALSLLVVALGSIYAFVSTGHRSARITNDFLQTQAQVRAALDNVVDELRWGQQVTAASATSVTVLVPQSTPFSAGSPYTVTFAYNATAQTVTRQEDPDATGPLPPTAAQPIAYSIVQANGSNGLQFQYFDAGGNSLGSAPADPSSVVRVRITVTTTRNGVSRTFAGDTSLRGR